MARSADRELPPVGSTVPAAAGAPAADFLLVEDLRVHFATNRGLVRAVDGISFELQAGGRLGIVGESGSGKTITAMSIMRLPNSSGMTTSGSIWFRGRDLMQLGEKELRTVRGKDIGFIPQDPMTTLNPLIRVGRQITEALHAHQRISRAAEDGVPKPGGILAFSGNTGIVGFSVDGATDMDTGCSSCFAHFEPNIDAIGEVKVLTSNFAAEYGPWIEDVLWALFPVCPPNGQGYSSGSVKGLYGIIYESFPVSPLHAAEGLIHEACHQYYHLAQLETLFANGQDTRLYWSPYPKQDRPIDRILLAFHAFANLVLFYRACLAGGMPFETERAEVEISFHIDNLRPLSEALEQSPGLTADGRALFEAIRERLFG